MRSKEEIRRIISNIQARLDARREPNGVALRVPAEGYAQDETWLSVIVSPDRPGMHAYQYVETLSEVESELRENGVEHVFLVPAITD